MGKSETAHSGRILVVDDDPVSRGLLSHILERHGYDVSRALGGVEAREMLTRLGVHEIDCVLTDYQMPQLDGLGLLVWLSSRPGAPSVVMVTGAGEKETIAESLRHGASDYLEKPVEPGKLIDAVQRAVQHTLHRREVNGLKSAAFRIAEGQQTALEANLGANVQFYHRARHALGGDSISRFDLKDGRRLYLVSDVSGHDLDSAFTSAYFQGVVRGMTERGASVAEILALFNRLLLTEWNQSRSEASISLCAIEIGPEQDSATVFRCGSPLVVYADGHGRARSVARGRTHPLGWFDHSPPAVQTLTELEGGTFSAWTDGLEDLAQEYGVSPLSLVYRMLNGADTSGLVSAAADDVLAARIELGAGRPSTGCGFVPLVTKRYWPAQVAEIDAVQEFWRRSLTLALPVLDPSRLYDILLCSREAVLNALEHGCQPGEIARFVLSYSPLSRSVRAHVSDPGEGHSRDLRCAQFDASSESRGRGLVLISHLADSYSLERRGADLMLEWECVE